MPTTVSKPSAEIVEPALAAVPALQIALPEQAEAPPPERYIVTLPRKVVWTLADLALVLGVGALVGTVLAFPERVTLAALALLGVSYPVACYVSGMYELDVRISGRRTFKRMLLASALVSGVAVPFSYALPSERVPSQLLVSVLALVLLLHPLTSKALNWLMHVSVPPLRVAVLGGGGAAEALVRVLEGSRHHHVVGVFRDDSRPTPIVAGRSVAGGASDLLRHGPDQIIVASTEPLSQGCLNALLEARTHGVPVTDIIPPYEALTGRVPVNHITKEWVAFASGFLPTRKYEAKVKRLMDVAVSLCMLAAFFPVGLVVALLVRLDSPGPLFHRQRRVGANSRIFEIIKFRTMRADAESKTGAVWATRNDSRVTRVGKWLRLSRLDEFPQLLNVLRGDMSLVGPRPERPEFVRLLAERVPFYELRHLVKPGITGWAQIRYPYGASVEDARIKLEYDLYYIRHRTPIFDLRILAKTVSVLLFAQGSR